MTLDHIVPASRGGTRSKINLLPACRHCNEYRGNMDLKHMNVHIDFHKYVSQSAKKAFKNHYRKRPGKSFRYVNQRLSR